MGSRAGFDFRVEYFKQIYLQYLNISKRFNQKEKRVVDSLCMGLVQYWSLVLQNQNQISPKMHSKNSTFFHPSDPSTYNMLYCSFFVLLFILPEQCDFYKGVINAKKGKNSFARRKKGGNMQSDG